MATFYMQQSKYDFKLISVIIAIRKLRGFTQENVADDLGIYRSYVVKIENGEVIARSGQLNEIAIILKTSFVNIVKIAEVFDMIDFEFNSVDEILKTFLIRSLIKPESINFTEEELYHIFTVMKRYYPKLSQRKMNSPEN